MKKDIRILTSLSNKVSDYASGHRCRHVAAVVRKSKIIAMGYNSMKTSPAVLAVSKNADKTCIHAEMDALRRAGDVRGLDLYIVRVDRNGERNNSKPCEVCQVAIDNAGLKRVIYTTTKGYDVVSRNEIREVA